jgi:probable HAF family extracellular repeat protein
MITNVIEDLGTLGGRASFGYGINAAGNVTGTSYLSFADPGYHAFRYVDGLEDIGALPPLPNSSFGQGINSSGMIVGGSWVFEGDAVPHAFLASATLNLITDLGTLGGGAGRFSFAYDINDQGQVTGEAETRTVDSHAFIWTSAGGMRDIGTLGGDRSVGRSINESGQVAGESNIGSNGSDAIRAFRFTEDAGMINLGTLSGGTRSSAYSINNSGQVVGESDTGPILNPHFRSKGSSFFGTHAFLWTEGVGMTDLGDLGGVPLGGVPLGSVHRGGTSQATAISNNGIVVGTSTLIDGTIRAFRWTQAGGMIDLNTLLPPNSGWVLTNADAVNDNGQITGTGVRNGASHAFRFNPPELVTPCNDLICAAVSFGRRLLSP